jgi:hypothetical protein
MEDSRMKAFTRILLALSTLSVSYLAVADTQASKFIQPGWRIYKHFSAEEVKRFTCPSDFDHVGSNDPNDEIMNRSWNSINEEKSLVPKNPSYRICSQDGRYVFFINQHFRASPPFFPYELYALNRKTLKLTLLHTSKFNVAINHFLPLSPQGKYLIGPPDVPKTVTLPDGPEVRVISVASELESSPKNYPPKYGTAVWAQDDSRLLLLDSKSQLSVLDLTTGEEKIPALNLPSQHIDLLVSSNRLYVGAAIELPSGGYDSQLYAYELDKISGAPKLIAKGLDASGKSIGEQNGVILTWRTFGVKHLLRPGHEFPEEEVSPHASVMVSALYPDGHEEPIFKFPYKFYFTDGGNDELSPSGRFVISTDSRGKPVHGINLLQRDDTNPKH